MARTITTWRLSYWDLKRDNLIYDNDSLSKRKTKRDKFRDKRFLTRKEERNVI